MLAVLQTVLQTLNISNTGIMAILSTMIIPFIWMIVFSYGAAQLSYCYNIMNGNAGSAIMWAVVCFFFPAFYYPYHALFLQKCVPAFVGGKK